MQPKTRHYFRLEISGSHTGSSFRYHSGIFGTLAEVGRALVKELRDPQGAAFIALEEPTLALEHYEGGVRRGAWSAFPAVRLRLGSKDTLAFEADGKLAGIDIDPSDGAEGHPVLGRLVEGDVTVEPLIDLSVLGIPAPNGVPERAGDAIAFERNGRHKTQPYGWVGEWDVSGLERYSLDPPGAKPAARKRRVGRRAKVPEPVHHYLPADPFALQFSADGRWLFVSTAQHFHIYDVPSGKLREGGYLALGSGVLGGAAVEVHFAKEAGAFVMLVAPVKRRGARAQLDPKASHVEAFTRVGYFSKWQVRSPAGRGGVRAIAVAPDSSHMAVAPAGGGCVLHDLQGGARRRDLGALLPKDQGPVSRLVFDGSGRFLAAAQSRRVVVIDVRRKGGPALVATALFGPHRAPFVIEQMRFAAGSERLVAAAAVSTGGPFALVLDVASGRSEIVASAGDAPWTSSATPLAVAPDTRSVLWLVDGVEPTRLEGFPGAILRHTPGRLLRQDLRTGALREIRRGPRASLDLPSGPALVAASPDGTLLAHAFGRTLQLTRVRKRGG